MRLGHPVVMMYRRDPNRCRCGRSPWPQTVGLVPLKPKLPCSSPLVLKASTISSIQGSSATVFGRWRHLATFWRGKTQPLSEAQVTFRIYSAPVGSSLVLISGLSYKITFNKELWTSSCPLYSIKPNLRNLFMKKLTRDRVVPIISASIS
jgi:hypothetical protein